MAINLYHASNNNGWFNIFGKAAKALNTLNTARLTTVPDTVLAILTQFENKTDENIAMQEAMKAIPPANNSWVRQGDALAAGMRGAMEKLLIEIVDANVAQPSKTLANALEQLRLEMVSQGATLDASTVGTSFSTGGSNIGDAIITYSTLRWDGKVQEHAIPEIITVEVINDSSATLPQLRFTTPAAVNKMGETWPDGSGIRVTLTATDASDSLLTNGDFEDETLSNLPNGWVATVGVRGTDYYLTDPEVQTVAVSGTPTAGYYILKYTTPGSDVVATPALDFDATSDEVQTALRTIPGLSAVTVSQSGTTPNLTHTITFTGVAGNIAQLTSVDMTTGGSHAIAHATTTAGDAGSYKGKALCLDADGSTLTALQQSIDLEYETVYFLHCRMIRVGAAATGTLKIEIIDGIGGSVIADGAGNNAELSVSVSGLGTSSHESKWFSFRIPKTIVQPVYVRIRFSVAPTATANVYIDEMALVEGRRLYPGGPYVAAFAGATAAVNGDTWALTITNDRAGAVNEAMNRWFDLAAKDILLPTDTGGGETIPDTVMS